MGKNEPLPTDLLSSSGVPQPARGGRQEGKAAEGAWEGGSVEQGWDLTGAGRGGGGRRLKHVLG